jgi:hypothetical protein
MQLGDLIPLTGILGKVRVAAIKVMGGFEAAAFFISFPARHSSP